MVGGHRVHLRWFVTSDVLLFSVALTQETDIAKSRTASCKDHPRRLSLNPPSSNVREIGVDNASDMNNLEHRFCIAPMMDWTDRHCRFFHRLLTRRARLYTEMVTAEAVLRGDRDRLLGFSAEEHPVALQLGGSRCRQARRSRRDRRGLRLRRDQPQRRLSLRSRAGGPLRCLPDGRAGTGGRVRGGHAGARARAGHRQVPHRHRRPGRRGRPRAFRLDRRRRRLPHLHRARAQGLAAGPVAQGEPRGAAARPRARSSPEGGAPRARDRHQRRHRVAGGGRGAPGARWTGSRSAVPPIRTRSC